jgi:polysaccharide biosynthesis/export protein
MKPIRLLSLIASLCTLMLSSCSLTHVEEFDAQEDQTPLLEEPSFANVDATPNAITPEMLKPPTKPFVLGPNDKIDVEIVDDGDTREELTVSPDGRIYYSLLPGMVVQGRSLPQVKADLETGLKQFYRDPIVSITVREIKSQRVWVLGRLNTPGMVPLSRPLRVLDAIALAGGLYSSRFSGTTQELADLDHSYLKRKGKLIPVNFQKLLREGDLSQNVYLEPDDYLCLPSSTSSEVYVLGAVDLPRPVSFSNKMNIVTALATARGAKPTADLSRVIIVRGTLTNPKYATVNLRGIMTGKVKNVRLQPGDIIYVPERATGPLRQGVLLATQSFAQAMGAREGANLVGSGNVGLNLSNDGNLNVAPRVTPENLVDDPDPDPLPLDPPAAP